MCAFVPQRQRWVVATEAHHKANNIYSPVLHRKNVLTSVAGNYGSIIFPLEAKLQLESWFHVWCKEYSPHFWAGCFKCFLPTVLHESPSLPAFPHQCKLAQHHPTLYLINLQMNESFSGTDSIFPPHAPRYLASCLLGMFWGLHLAIDHTTDLHNKL